MYDCQSTQSALRTFCRQHSIKRSEEGAIDLMRSSRAPSPPTEPPSVLTGTPATVSRQRPLPHQMLTHHVVNSLVEGPRYQIKEARATWPGLLASSPPPEAVEPAPLCAPSGVWGRYDHWGQVKRVCSIDLVFVPLLLTDLAYPTSSMSGSCQDLSKTSLPGP